LHFAPTTGISTLLFVTSLQAGMAAISKQSDMKKALAFGKLNTRGVK
jgi:hypothetical protein